MNIFKNSEFGDKFKIKDDRIALFDSATKNCAYLLVQGTLRLIGYNLDGTVKMENRNNFDIVCSLEHNKTNKRRI